MSSSNHFKNSNNNFNTSSNFNRNSNNNFSTNSNSSVTLNSSPSLNSQQPHLPSPTSPLFTEQLINSICCSILNRLLAALNCFSPPVSDLHELDDGVVLVELIEAFEETVFLRGRGYNSLQMTLPDQNRKSARSALSRRQARSNMEYVEQWLLAEGVHLDPKRSIREVFAEIRRSSQELANFLAAGKDTSTDDDTMTSLLAKQRVAIYARSIAYISALCYAIFTIFLKADEALKKLLPNYRFTVEPDELLHVLFYTKWKLTEEELLLKDLQYMRIKDGADMLEIENRRLRGLKGGEVEGRTSADGENKSSKEESSTDPNSSFETHSHYQQSQPSFGQHSGSVHNKSNVSQAKSSSTNEDRDFESVSSVTLSSVAELRSVATQTDIFGLENELLVKYAFNRKLMELKKDREIAEKIAVQQKEKDEEVQQKIDILQKEKTLRNVQNVQNLSFPQSSQTDDHFPVHFQNYAQNYPNQQNLSLNQNQNPNSRPPPPNYQQTQANLQNQHQSRLQPKQPDTYNSGYHDENSQKIFNLPSVKLRNKTTTQKPLQENSRLTSFSSTSSTTPTKPSNLNRNSSHVNSAIYSRGQFDVLEAQQNSNLNSFNPLNQTLDDQLKSNNIQRTPINFEYNKQQVELSLTGKNQNKSLSRPQEPPPQPPTPSSNFQIQLKPTANNEKQTMSPTNKIVKQSNEITSKSNEEAINQIEAELQQLQQPLPQIDEDEFNSNENSNDTSTPFHSLNPVITNNRKRLTDDEQLQNRVLIARLLAELSYEKNKNLRQTNQDYI